LEIAWIFLPKLLGKQLQQGYNMGVCFWAGLAVVVILALKRVNWSLVSVTSFSDSSATR
jgi:hypothetical protein